jgi:NADH:ubiquinone oxidoreductase subunit C
MTPDEIKSRIETEIPGTKLKIVRDSILIGNPADLVKVASFLKYSHDFLMDYLSSVTAVDYIQYLESVYHLYSMEKRTGPVILRVRVPRREPHIPSMVPLYRGAELQERENFDMFGIIYDQHPDLRRLFLWENFEGHPLRKDYRQEDSETLEMEDVEWLDKHGVTVPKDIRKQAKELQSQGKRALSQKEGKEGA